MYVGDKNTNQYYELVVFLPGTQDSHNHTP